MWVSEKGSERSYQDLGKKGTHDVRVDLTTIPCPQIVLLRNGIILLACIEYPVVKSLLTVCDDSKRIILQQEMRKKESLVQRKMVRFILGICAVVRQITIASWLILLHKYILGIL